MSDENKLTDENFYSFELNREQMAEIQDLKERVEKKTSMAFYQSLFVCLFIALYFESFHVFYFSALFCLFNLNRTRRYFERQLTKEVT